MIRQQAILNLVRTVAEALGSDLEKFVFVGGAAVALLIDNPAAGDVRPTDDVDLVSDVSTYGQYAELTALLRDQHGFQHDMNGPLCRFTVRGVTVDVMPTNEEVIRFANKWYKHVVAKPIHYALSENITIQLVAPSVLLCTKLEAFADRGNNDYYGSHDLEDVITLIDARDSILTECQSAPVEIRGYLSDTFTRLIEHSEFLDSLEGFLPLGSAARLVRLKEKLVALANLL